MILVDTLIFQVGLKLVSVGLILIKVKRKLIMM